MFYGYKEINMTFVKEFFSGINLFVVVIGVIASIVTIFGIITIIGSDLKSFIIIGLLILIIFILCSFYTYKEKIENYKEKTDYYKVIEVKKRTNALRMVIEPNTIKHGTLVLVYHIDQSSENVIGCGTKIFTQEDGNVQIDAKIDEKNEFYKKISENNLKIIPKIRITPYINYKFFREMKQ